MRYPQSNTGLVNLSSFKPTGDLSRTDLVYNFLFLESLKFRSLVYPTLFIFEPHLGHEASLCFVPQLMQ